MSRADYIQNQEIPPDIDPDSDSALRQVIQLAKSNYKKLYDLEERLEKIERFFTDKGGV